MTSDEDEPHHRRVPIIDHPRSIALLHSAQVAFQHRHCPSYLHYDTAQRDYREKAHPYKPGDCTWHWTDLCGTCCNYRPSN